MIFCSLLLKEKNPYVYMVHDPRMLRSIDLTGKQVDRSVCQTYSSACSLIEGSVKSKSGVGRCYLHTSRV